MFFSPWYTVTGVFLPSRFEARGASVVSSLSTLERVFLLPRVFYLLARAA